MIRLGTLCRDKLTGVAGVVTCRAEYLSGEVHYLLERASPPGGDGSICRDWLDSSRLEEVLDDKTYATQVPQ